MGGYYEPISQQEVLETINCAYESGVQFFDLAPVYGYGNAERNVGHALQSRPRDEIFVSTKIGRLLLDPTDPSTPAEREDVMVLWEGEQLYKGMESVCPYFDFSRDGVRRSIEDSLKRTGLDRFDTLHIHNPDLYPRGHRRCLSGIVGSER